MWLSFLTGKNINMNIINTNVLKIGVGILIILAVLAFSGVFSQDKSQSIKVGVVLPLTSVAADYGQAVKKGIDLAVEKSLKDYQIGLEMVYEDSQADPKLAVSAIQKLITIDHVKYVIGFSSGEMLAMCPVAEANKVILISPASSPELTTKCGDYTFRNIPSDIYQGKALADKVMTKGYQKVAILYINNDYGVGLKEEFVKNFRGTITDIESHKPSDADFRTQLTKIKAGQPEAVVLISHMAEGSIILRQMLQFGINQPIFASETLKDPSLFKLGAETLKNLYVNFISQYQGQAFLDFRDGYQKKYGQEFGAYSDYEYDNALTLAKAMSSCRGGDDVKCVKDKMYGTNIIGATGLINFDSNGDRVNKDYVLYKIEDGKFVEEK
jgi:branched-chain amino acid transport system substrate-binding protein